MLRHEGFTKANRYAFKNNGVTTFFYPFGQLRLEGKTVRAVVPKKFQHFDFFTRIGRLDLLESVVLNTFYRLSRCGGSSGCGALGRTGAFV